MQFFDLQLLLNCIVKTVAVMSRCCNVGKPFLVLLLNKLISFVASSNCNLRFSHIEKKTSWLDPRISAVNRKKLEDCNDDGKVLFLCSQISEIEHNFFTLFSPDTLIIVE